MVSAPIKISPQLALIINNAGKRNNVDFNYLLQTAIRESSLNPNAKAKSSSALGLFQFIEATWLETMKAEGARLGYQNYANAIKIDEKGNYFVKDKKLLKEILELRKNPQIAADLAAAFTRKNGEYLTKAFGRMPSAGELYIAHFLGAKGAEKLFREALKDPNQIAADLFPNAAKANRTIFYENNRAKTIKQVYLSLVAKHKVNNNESEFLVQQIASQNIASQNVTSTKPEPVNRPAISFENFYSLKVQNSAPISLSNEGTNNITEGFFIQLYNK